MASIKLIELNPIDSTRRFASQLMVNRGVADFIIEDGKMKVWGARGSWVPFEKEYEIVKNITVQQL